MTTPRTPSVGGAAPDRFYDNADCAFGDHSWLGNGHCQWCAAFNGGMLAWSRYDTAEREGRAHYGHFHRTLERKDACRRQPDADWTEAYGEVDSSR